MAVQSVERAMFLLQSLTSGTKTLTELSAVIGIGVSGTLKLLRTLLEQELVVRCNDGTYALGVTCCTLARGYLQQHPLIERARPAMETLAHHLDGRVVLAALCEGVQVNLLQIDPHNSSPDSSFPLRVGGAWSQATGRVLLAFASPQTRAAHFSRFPPLGAQRLPVATSTCDALLAEVCATGTAIIYASENVSYLASPVYNLAGEVIAALGAHATGADIPAATTAVSKTATAISHELGYNLTP